MWSGSSPYEVSFEASEMTVGAIVDDIAPIVRKAMPRFAFVIAWPVLTVLIRVVLWVLIAKFGPRIAAVVDVASGSLGPALKPECLRWLEAFSRLANPSPLVIPEGVLAAVGPRTPQYGVGDVCRSATNSSADLDKVGDRIKRSADSQVLDQQGLVRFVPEKIEPSNPALPDARPMQAIPWSPPAQPRLKDEYERARSKLPWVNAAKQEERTTRGRSESAVPSQEDAEPGSREDEERQLGLAALARAESLASSQPSPLKGKAGDKMEAKDGAL